MESADSILNAQLEQMQSYIKIKGARQIGPLIQYVKTQVAETGINVDTELMFQCNNLIHSVEEPYGTESLIRVPNCIYCRYMGPAESLRFAYDKINLYAFENDIKLNGENYTIFVEQNEEDMIVADVFAERADDETN
jgi:hypothetical protein